MGTGLELGDPALNAWILAADVHSILTDPINLFNTNIFYPQTHNNLAFSENLIGDMPIAFPIIALTGNVVLAYNTIFILSFILTGLGVFLLTDHYLNNKYSAFLAGFAFTFCAFRFAHLGHLQLLTAQWMPFSILYFDLFMHKSSYKNLFLAYIFYVLQVLSCWYYAFYLSFSLGLYIIYKLLINNFIRKKLLDRTFQIKTFFLSILIIATILPFAIPYFQVADEYDASRPLAQVNMYSGDISDYLLAPPSNAFYGKMHPSSVDSREWLEWPEHSLYPGGLVIFLSLFGILCLRKSNNFYYLGFNGSSIQNFYLILGILAFVLSLGTIFKYFGNTLNIYMPYNFFYEYFPGFKSMRAPVRWGVIVTFSLSILAGYGFNKLIKNKSSIQQLIIFLFCLTVIFIESIYIPLSFGITPLGQDVPPVYEWLSNQTDDFVIVELPMVYVDKILSGIDLYNNTKYMYYSTYHWKTLVNGYSGYYTKYHIELISILKTFPSHESISLLENLGVKYVILHKKEIDRLAWSRIQQNITNLKDNVELIEILDQDYVYKIIPKNIKLENNKHSFKIGMPTQIGKGGHYYGSIMLTNQWDRAYISKFNEKIRFDIKISSSKEKYYENRYEVPSPIIIQPNSSFNIPFIIDSPDIIGDYTLYVTILGSNIQDNKIFKKELRVLKNMPDSSIFSNVSGDLIAFNLPDRVKAGETFQISFLVKNDGNVLWRSQFLNSSPYGVVSVGSRWLKDGKEVWRSERGHLPFDLSPGQNASFTMEISTPDLSGNYILELDLVSELMTWFESNNGEYIKEKIEVIN